MNTAAISLFDSDVSVIGTSRVAPALTAVPVETTAPFNVMSTVPSTFAFMLNV